MSVRFVALILAFLVLSPVMAQAAVQGASCDGITIGTTQMSSDQHHILACVYVTIKNDDGTTTTTQMWKSMTPLVTRNTGNIGINNVSPKTMLDVSGDVKIGQDDTVCRSTTAGAIRYNSTDKVIEYCNGSAWSAIGGASCAQKYVSVPEEVGPDPMILTIPAGKSMEMFSTEIKDTACFGTKQISDYFYQCKDGDWTLLLKTSRPSPNCVS